MFRRLILAWYHAALPLSLALFTGSLQAQNLEEDQKRWLQGEWVEVKDGKAVNAFTFFDQDWLAMDTAFKRYSPILYRIEEVDLREDTISVESFEKLEAALGGRTGRELSRMSGLEREQWRMGLDKETRIAMIMLALSPRREHKLNSFDFGGERSDLTRVDLKIARPTNIGSEFPRPMEFKTQWLRFLHGDTRLYLIGDENRSFVRADSLAPSERESYRALARSNKSYLKTLYQSYKTRVFQLTKAGVPADECRAWRDRLLSLGIEGSPEVVLDSVREVPLPGNDLYAFLKYVESRRAPDDPSPPELRYYYRVPVCAQRRSRQLYPAFASEVGRNNYADTVWVMQITPALNDKPKNWSRSAYSKYMEAFRNRPSHQKIPIHLRPNGVFGFRGAYDVSNRWSFDGERLTLEWGSLAQKATFNMKSKDGQSYQTRAIASLFGDSLTARISMYTTYANFFSDFSHEHQWSAALNAKYQEEAALLPLDCWPGGPDDLSGIPQSYWLRDRAQMAQAGKPSKPASHENTIKEAPGNLKKSTPSSGEIKSSDERLELVGSWKWSNGASIQIEKGGVARNGAITGKWIRLSENSSSFQIVWPDGLETVTLSDDGNRFEGKGFFGTSLSAQRIQSNGNNIVGVWRRHDGLVMNIKANGQIEAGPFKGSWKRVEAKTYQFAYPIVDRVILSEDGKTLEVGNQFGSVTATRDDE